MSIRALTSGPSTFALPTVNRNSISQSKKGAAEWVRPAEWLAMPDITGQQRFAGLHLIALDGNFVALSAAGNYTVDWGDGTSTNHNSGAVAYKQYNYADISDTGESALGYRQVLISVTPQAGQNLTSFNLQHRHNQAGLNAAYSPLWLDIAINSVNLTTLAIGGGIVLSSLQRVVILGHALTSMGNMFNGCSSLTTVPLFNTASVTDMSTMFTSCSSLTTVPLFNTAIVTNMSNMFTACLRLTTVPLFNTASVNDMSSMFSSCSSLTTVPSFNTASVNNMTSMFNSCFSLTTVPLFNTAIVTSMSSMFATCRGLTTVPLFNTAIVTSMSSMFTACVSLTTVPLFNTASVNNMSSMFASCFSLTTVPLFNTAIVTSMSSMFANCRGLTTVPAMNANAATTLAIVASGGNISRFDMINLVVTITFASQKLSKDALERIFLNLLRSTVSTTITISGNYGADTAVSKTACGTTALSKTITQASTAGLAVGMRVTGTGFNDAVAVTFQDTGDTVTLNSHGFDNDTKVSFATVVTTTGILTNTRFFVINATANTFQLAATIGGAAIALTTDGSGTVRYPSYITAITTDTSVTVSAPASVTGTNTLAFRVLDAFEPIARGWTVSG